jgi:hypothetical protein
MKPFVLTASDIAVARSAWRAERTDQLTNDTAELLNAMEDDSAMTLLGDILNAMKLQESGATAADHVIIRYGLIDRRIAQEIEWTLEREDALGLWQSYINEPEPEREAE